MKRWLLCLPIAALIVSGCQTKQTLPSPHANSAGTSTKDNVRVRGMFNMKPVLPVPGNDHSGVAAWNTSNLPTPLKAVNKVPNGVAWQPINFGKNEPLIAGQQDRQYIATDAGVFYRDQRRFTFMPGTEAYTPISAITVTPGGAPIIAAGKQIFAYVSRKWIRISDHQLNGSVQSLRWTKDGQLAAMISTYPKQNQGSSVGSGGPAPMPVPGMLVFDGKTWHNVNPKIGSRNLLPAPTDNSVSGQLAMGVHFAGLSPSGVPTLELMRRNLSHRTLWQYKQGQWQEFDMSSFPEDKFDFGSYVEPQDVTWLDNHLIVSSPVGGAMSWNGSTWNPLGSNRGMTSNYHRFGSVTSTSTGAVFAEVKETVPPPPHPGREFNTLWVFKQSTWHQLSFPKPSPGFVYGDPVVSPTGTIAISESYGWAGNKIWLYQNHRWTEVADGIGVFRNDHVGEMKFFPNGKLTVQLVGGIPASANNIYEWTGVKWVPLLTNNTVVGKKGTDWFNYTWAPDGSIIIGLMNGSGYSVWRYKRGTWTNLHLNGQRPESLYVTKQNTLFVITDNDVCWRLNLH